MKIYVTHSSNFDYKNDLYLPIRNSILNTQHKFIFPYETGKFFDTKDVIKNSDVIIAEVSYPSTGMGIELAWANSFNKPIFCLYKKGIKPSKSLNVITNTIISYTDSSDMINKIIGIV